MEQAQPASTQQTPQTPPPSGVSVSEPPKRTLSDFAKSYSDTLLAESQETGQEQQQEVPEQPQEPQETPLEAEPQVEAQPDTPEPEEPLKTVEFEGRTYSVPQEIERALLRHADYTRKTQDLAQQRQQVEMLTHQAQMSVQIAQQFGDVLGQIKQAETAIQGFHNLNWQELRASDPVEYAAKLSDFNAWQQHLNGLHGQMNEAQQRLGYQQAQLAQQKVREAASVLQERIPGWGQQKQQELRSAAQSFGYSDQELSTLMDPRFVLVLNEANEFRKLKAKKVEVQKKPLPPVAKPSARPQQDAKAAYQKSRDDFRKGGGKDLGTLADALRARMNRT